MKGNFNVCLPVILKYEGGRSNQPNDPGGKTFDGVTQRVYDAYRATHSLPWRDVYQIADDERDYIYQAQYWNAVRGDDMPSGVDLVLFDYAVNSGPVAAIRALQRVLRIPVDGHLGLATMDAAHNRMPPPALVFAISAQRLAFLESLRQLWRTFGMGWKSRVIGVRTIASKM